MNKTLLTLVIPILAIIIGIGLVIGSFQVQTKTATTSTPIAAESSALANSNNSEKVSPHQKAKKEKKSDQTASIVSSERTKSDEPEAAEPSLVNPSSDNQSSKSGTIKTNKPVAQESDHTKSNRQTISESSGSSSRPAPNEEKVPVAIQGLDGFNTQGSVTYQSNDSVFSELQRFTKTKNIELGYSGFGSSIYVSSINNQKASQTSPASGWMYTVNGKAPNISAGAYHVQPNDTINWYYSK